MRVKARKQIFENVLEFPVKSAAGEIEMVSKEFAPFEHTTPGPINYHVYASDDSAITDTVTLKLQVSYDKGNTWVNAEEISDLANGSGDSVSVYKAGALKAAPRTRLVAVLNSSSRIAEEAMPGVTIEVEEQEDLERSEVFNNVVGFDASEANKTIDGDVFTVDGDIQEIVVSHSGNSAKMTNVTWILQSSFDTENWWNVTSSANISSSNFSETSISSKLGKYFRVVTTLGATGLQTGHNLVFNVVCFYC